MKQCYQCGHINDDSQAFCGQCGNNLNTVAQQPTPQYQPQPQYPTQPQYIPAPEPPKKKRKGCLITICVFISVFILFCVFTALVSDSDDTNSNNAASNASDTTANNNLIDNKYELALLDSSVVEDYDGQKVLIITFDFKNLTDEATNFSYSLTAKAFDDGVELDTPISMWGIDGYDFHNNDLDIKPGKSIQVQKAYYLNSNTKEVEIEISPWVSFTDKVYKTYKVTVE